MIYCVLDSAGKEPACQCRRYRRHGSRRSPGKGNGNPFQSSCLGNPMDRGAWWATVQKCLKRVRHDLATKQQQQYINSFIATVRKLVFWK